MPDLPPRTLQFDLRPDKEQALIVCGKAIASFQLVGMVLYAKDYHYIADVRDPRIGAGWLRIDSNDADGVGQATAPASNRIKHKNRIYYPVVAAYVRVPPGSEGEEEWPEDEPLGPGTP